MKKFLKLAIIPAAFITVGLTTGCNVAKKEVALITDVGDIDDGSFNQASWEAIKEYCGNNNKSYDYYRPFADSDFARRCAIKQAVFKGAKIIVCPGFKFANAVSQAQNDYKNVHFILLDAVTSNDVNPNTVCVGYNCEISGYLAGYTIAQDLLTYDLTKEGRIRDNYNYGYCGGMASDGVLQFGFGFFQGCICGTYDFLYSNGKNLDQPKLNFKHHYAGVFAQSDDAASKMKGWYAGSGNDDETKVVFACGGKLFQSVTEGVKDYNRKNNMYDAINSGDVTKDYKLPRNAARWVGVDSDQYKGLSDEHEKKTIYTSALKGLNPTIQIALKYHFDETWEDQIGGDGNNGKQWKLGIKSKFGRVESKAKEENFVGIPDVSNDNGVLRGYYNYTKEKYDDLLNNLQTNEVYGNDGTELYDSKGNQITPENPLYTKYKIKAGCPEFMNYSNDVHVKATNANGEQVESFNTKYFKGYNQANIKVTVVD